MNRNFIFRGVSLCKLAAALLISLSPVLTAQTTTTTGKVNGTVTDPRGVQVGEAKVTITNTSTNQKVEVTTNTTGEFVSGPLEPGNYTVQVTAKGFPVANANAAVQAGATTAVNVKLAASLEMRLSERATIQGAVTSPQIENQLANGRNFLDFAQLEPGIQIQDGRAIASSKAGLPSISFGGRYGRTSRVAVDGADISDETVGAITTNLPATGIDELRLSQSMLDASEGLTSSGAVNITTRSGTNALHGEAFGLFRDHSINARPVGGKDLYSERQDYGGRLGGPVMKNKLFFFGDGERMKQDSFSPVIFTGTPYASNSSAFRQPFVEDNVIGRLDYNLSNGAKAFYRYSYFDNSLPANAGLSVYESKNTTQQHSGGYDFGSGKITHSIRGSYLKFENQIADATRGNKSLPFCCSGLSMSSGTFVVGPSVFAPQRTSQSNIEARYDGTKLYDTHTLRFGVSYDYIQAGGFANLYGNAPQVSWITDSVTEAFAASGPFPGGVANPLNYPVNRLRVGNGQGYSSHQSALGFPAGGLGPDNRLGVYVGDAWKIKPNLTLTAGLRYDRDTGRNDSNFPADPSINAVFGGFGAPVRQPNLNFAPQLGFAWDPNESGKTVVRGGIGLFYENALWSNLLADRRARLRTGAVNAVTDACLNGIPQPVPSSSGTILPVGICGNDVRIGDVGPQIQSFWQSVLAGNAVGAQAPNPAYAGTLLNEGLGQPAFMFAPNYRTPRSVQMNIGMQREIRRGLVFSIDYLRNVETHTLLAIDQNKVGDTSTFSIASATQAINVTNAAFGCPAGPGGVDCAIKAGASINDYVRRGLGVPNDVAGVGCAQPVSAGGLGYPCAFGGLNPLQNSAFFLQPVGRSVYKGIQFKLAQEVNKPFRAIRTMNLQLAYSLTNFSSDGGAQLTGTPADNDQDLALRAADNNKVGRYYGNALLDRKHQLSFGGYADIPAGFRIDLMAHFYSPLSSAIVAPNYGNVGEIFRTDFTGDGTVGDPLPGTHLGQFGRQTDAHDLVTISSVYNTTHAGQPTPAGNLLVTNGLMNGAQLVALGAVAPHICLPPPALDPDPSCTAPDSPGNQVDFAWLRILNLRLSWRHTFLDRFTVEPSVSVFNAPNFNMFNLPPNMMTGILFGNGNGAINGTTPTDNNSFRLGNGTGVYGLGGQRQIEFGLRIVF